MILMLWVSGTQSPQWMIINAYMLLSGSCCCLFQRLRCTLSKMRRFKISWKISKHLKVRWIVQDCVRAGCQDKQPLQMIVIHKKAFIENTTLVDSYKILKVKCDLQLFHMNLFTACTSRASLKQVSVFILMRTWTCQTPAACARIHWSAAASSLGRFRFCLCTSLFLLLLCVHVAQTELLLADDHQQVSAAVPLQRLDQEFT